MKIFDLFKRKEEKKEETSDKEKIGDCPICNKPVYKNDRYRTINYGNHKFVLHLECFRKAKKEAIKFLSGDIKF